jgi:hypothetical protein
MTAIGPAQPLYRLPPRPVLRDWLWAGASAGLVFGMAELAVAIPSGFALDPRLAALVLGIDSVLVALGSILVGAILRASSIRVSRSGLVGAVVGPLLFAAISGRFWSALTADGLPSMIDLSGLMTAALFATAAGLTASRLADALERRGVVCSALYVWGAVSLPLAASERLTHVAWFTGSSGVLCALAVVLSVAAVTWATVEIAQRRESRSPRSFGWLLLWLAATSTAVAAAPSLLPWIYYDRDAPEIGIGPPNFLVVLLPDSNGSGASSELELRAARPNLEQLAFEGSTVEVFPQPMSGVARALLIDTREVAVVPQLSAAGYATAAILPDDNAPPELAAAEMDAQPGARKLLEDSLAWLGSARLLIGPALPLLRVLGLDTQTRDVGRVTERAKAWLLDWRMDRVGSPFFLFVDFRNAAPPERGGSLVERSDTSLGDLLEHLRMLGVEESTLVAVLGAERSGEHLRTRPSRIVVRAPTGESPRTRSAREISASAGQLGDFLIELSQGDGTIPVTLSNFPKAP